MGNAAPLLNTTLRHAVPMSFGSCDDGENPPPKPCEGTATLYEKRTGTDNFIEARWLSGINTVSLNVCKLWKDPPVMTPGFNQTRTQYHLTLSGQFDYLKLMLHVNQCPNVPLLGCTTM